MGARPTALLVGLAAPGDLPVQWALDLIRGLVAECAETGAVVAGGDTSSAETVMLAGSSDSGSFTATADGSPLPAVQWQYSTDRRGRWTNISGATSTTLNFTAVPYLNYVFSLGNAFRAVFTNAAGTAVSRPAKQLRDLWPAHQRKFNLRADGNRARTQKGAASNVHVA